MRSLPPLLLAVAGLALGGAAPAPSAPAPQTPVPAPPAAAPAAAAPSAAPPSPASAPPPALDAAGAQAIADGIHALLADTLGGFAPAADLVRVTVQGDHDHLEIPLAHRWPHAAIGGDSIGADLFPLADGRWRIANGAMPGHVEINLDHPGPNIPGAITITSGENSFSGVIDTTLATETKLDFHIRDQSVTGEGAQTSTGSHLDRGDGTLAVTPDGDGTATLLATSTMRGLRTTSAIGKQVSVNSVAHSTGSLRVTHLSFPAMRAALRALSGFLQLAQGQAAAPPAPNLATTQEQREDLHTLIAALAMSATSLSLEQSQDGTSFGAGPVPGKLSHAGFAMDLANQDGDVTLALRLQLDDLSLPSLPQGVLTEFLPRRILLRPRLSGIDAAALRRALDAAVDNPAPGAFVGLSMAVLDAHPATIAIDALAIDTGPAAITGHGTLTVRGPGDAEGSATLRATGLDAAMQLLAADPRGRQALAGLIFLKGLGKPDGDAMVWDLAFDGQKLLVNGTDISGMAPGARAPRRAAPLPPK